MKKLLCTLMMAAVVGLTGCQASSDSGAAKSALEGKGYSVEIMTETEAKGRISGMEWCVSFKDVVYATKKDGVFLGFYCNNIEDASKLMETNVSVLYHFAEKYAEDPKTGQYNNVCYVASRDAAIAVGFIPSNS